MVRPHPSWLLALALPLAACDGGLACDESAAYSVTVSVFDSAGDPYAPDEVTYEVDGSAETSCEPISRGTEFLCGIEEIGTFTIRVYDPGLVAEEQLDVDLGPDGCHVDSVFLDITL